MFIYNNGGLGSIGDRQEPSSDDLQKMIEAGDIIQKIADGLLPATEEQRTAARQIVAAMG